MELGLFYSIYSEWVWLPGEVRWNQLRRGDLWFIHVVPWLALLLLMLRCFVHCIADAAGRSLGVCNKNCNQPPRNAVLQTAFASNKRPSTRQEEALAEQVGWPPRRVQQWMHRARNWQKPSTLMKFKECSWRLLLYTSSTTYGGLALINEPYLLDLPQCYAGYPTKTPSRAAMGYWSLQLALYIAELVSSLTGTVPRKKDNIAMMIHHGTTIALLVICYIINMVPIGLVIALLHDMADVFLEMAKLMVYVGCPRTANSMFCAFTLVFVATRLVVLPNWVLPSLIYDLPQYAGHHSHVTMTAIILIIGLLCLHVYWLILIVKVALQLMAGPIHHDSRSDSEPSSSDSEQCSHQPSLNHN